MCRVESVRFLLVLVLYDITVHSNVVPSLLSKAPASLPTGLWPGGSPLNVPALSAQGQHVCTFNNSVCLTWAANRVYKVLLSGVRGLFDPIDPIHVAKIEGSMLTLDYTLYNATMTGLKDCNVELFKIENDSLAYEYRLHCPQLDINYYYEVKGTLEGHDVDGEGYCTVIAYDYVITFKGLLEKVHSILDPADRIGVKEYHVETDLRNKFTFENENLTRGDKETFKFVKRYINSNWKNLEQCLRSPILESFLEVFVKSVDAYARAFPLIEMLRVV